MINYIRLFFENLSNERKTIALGSGLWGWFKGLILLDVGGWQFIVSGGKSLGLMAVSLVTGLVITDFYKKRVSHKLFKNKKNGNNKKEENSSEAEERA